MKIKNIAALFAVLLTVGLASALANPPLPPLPPTPRQVAQEVRRHGVPCPPVVVGYNGESRGCVNRYGRRPFFLFGFDIRGGGWGGGCGGSSYPAYGPGTQCRSGSENGRRETCDTRRIDIDVENGFFTEADIADFRSIADEAMKRGGPDDEVRNYAANQIREMIGSDFCHISGIKVVHVGTASGRKIRDGRNGYYQAPFQGMNHPPYAAPGSVFGTYRVNGDLVQASISPSGNLVLTGTTQGFLENTPNPYITAPHGQPLPFGYANTYRRAP